MLMDGYGHLLWQGTWITIRLAFFALLLAMLLGLAGAGAKLSPNRLLRLIGGVYTTVIRSVPDLVTMLLLYYSLQLGLNELTDALGWSQIDIDPFVAGVVTLGFIYGAYFTETFRGAFMGVPTGQGEAARAYGMSRLQTFRRVLFPQMMRHALPGLGNNLQVMIKATALVSILGLNELVKMAQDAGKASMKLFYFSVVSAAIYLAITTVVILILMWLDRRYSHGVRRAEL